MIKGKAPYPFQTIVLAISFSPELPFLVSEMRRLCDLHRSQAVFIHVGKKTGEKQRDFSSILNENGFHDGNSRIYWENGDVVNTILEKCKHEVADLLIIGASEKNNFGLPVGKNAHNFAIRAKCSVLIYSKNNKGPFKKIVVNGIEHDKTELTLLTSIYFGENEKSDEILVVEENDRSFESGDTNLMTSDSYLLREPIEKAKVRVNFVTISSENSSDLSDFAFKEDADLLVTYSSDHKLLIFDRIVSENGIESLLKKLPCNLLVVHSRLPD